MRTRIRKHLFEVFQRELESRYPSFGLIEPPTRNHAVWSMPIGSELSAFVALIFFPNKDTFVVELAWSPSNSFPWESMLNSLDVWQSLCRNRMGFLWKKTGMEPVWELAPEDTFRIEAYCRPQTDDVRVEFAALPSVETVLPRVEPAVKEFLEKFQQYAVPLFNKLATYHGLRDVV